MPLLLIEVEGFRFLQHQDFAIHPDADETGATGGLENVLVLALLAAHLGGQQSNAAVFGKGQDSVNNLLDGLPLHGPAALGTVGLAHAGEKEPQVVVNLGNGAYRGSGVVGDAFLVNGYCRGKTLNVVHVGLVHASQELASVGRQGLNVPPLSLSVNGVESQGAFAGTGHAGNNYQLVSGNGYLYVLEVVLPGALDMDKVLRHRPTSWIEIVKADFNT